MYRALLMSEFRAAKRPLLFQLALVVLLLLLTALLHPSGRRIETELTLQYTVWSLQFLFCLMLTLQLFGREWVGGGQRLRARLPVTTGKLWLVKFSVSAALGMLVFLAVLVIAWLTSLLILDQPLSITGSLPLQFMALCTALAIFGLGAVAGTYCSRNSTALLFSLLLLGVLPFIGFWIFDSWLSYHDVPKDCWEVAIPVVLLLLFALCLGLSFLIFKHGRLHQGRLLRRFLVLSIALCAFAVPATFLARAQVAAWDQVSPEDPTLLIGYMKRDPTVPGRIIVDLSRPNRSKPHSLLLNIDRKEVEAFLPQCLSFGRRIEDARPIYGDYSSLDAFGRREIDWQHDVRYWFLDEAGQKQDYDPSNGLGRELSGFSTPIIAKNDLIVFLNRKSGAMQVLNRETEEVEAQYKLSYQTQGFQRWRDDWVSHRRQSEGGSWQDALCLTDIWTGEEQLIPIESLEDQESTDSGAFYSCLTAGNEVYFSAAHDRVIRAMNLKTRVVREVYRLPPNTREVTALDRSTTGRFIQLSYRATLLSWHHLLLDSATGVSHDLDSRGLRLRHTSELAPNRCFSNDDRYALLDMSDNSTAVWDLDSFTMIHRLGLQGFSFWIDDHRLLIASTTRIHIFNAQTKTEELLWKVSSD